MGIVFSFLLACAMAVPAPEAKPEAEADPALLYYGYPSYHYYPYHPYYRVFGKRSAESELYEKRPFDLGRQRREAEAGPTAEAGAEAEADPWLYYYHHYGYPYHYGYYGYPYYGHYVYGK